MPDAGPTRGGTDLADVVELLLDKGLVVNADIAVSVGDTELLGIEIRAAVASFETAAQYGLAFPDGTDQERIEQAARRRNGAGETRRATGVSEGVVADRPKQTPAVRPGGVAVEDESDASGPSTRVDESDPEPAVPAGSGPDGDDTSSGADEPGTEGDGADD